MLNNSSAIGIIGLGLIGGSIGGAFKKKGYRVVGVSSKKTVERGLELGIIDSGYTYDQMGEALKGCEYIFICTPLTEIIKMIPEVYQAADKGAIISDVGSTKEQICSVAQRSIEKIGNKGVYFVGGHPMAGSEKRGVDNSNPYLFYDAVWVLTPLGKTPRRIIKRISSLIELTGAKVMIINPELHDKIAANVSHLPQLIAVLLTNQLADRDDDLYRNLAAGGFRDMTRIASSDFGIWSDIIYTNSREIRRALEEFRERIDTLLSNLENFDFLEDSFKKASKERKIIPRYSKGFLTPLIDVRVTVKDRPGELAKITNIIYYQGVNIKDIEIVNIREGEGGILRLGFAEKREAGIAARALSGFGYDVVIVE